MAVTAMTARDFARLPDDELLEIYHMDREPRAREQLVKRFLPFARKLALRYVHSREPLDDLVQVASVGLLNAIERFEPGRGKKFTSSSATSATRAGRFTSRAISRSARWRSAVTPSACRPRWAGHLPSTSWPRPSNARWSR
jgi:DNA-directed RNA polymerase sigma subunit (sigma70/sigma32)